MTTLCASYGISRETGYKWQSRYAAGGIEALVDVSRARHSQSATMSAEVAGKALALRQRWPRWGPKKLRAALMREWPGTGKKSALIFPAPRDARFGRVHARESACQTAPPFFAPACCAGRRRRRKCGCGVFCGHFAARDTISAVRHRFAATFWILSPMRTVS